MANRRLIRLAALGAGLLVTILCLLTMNRTFGFIDSGEMAASASILGVPHPTGYPLLMILGHVATLLIPGRDIIALNILAALMTGAGTGVMTLLFARLLRPLAVVPTAEPDETLSEKTRGEGEILAVAVPAALLVSMTTVWWSQGTGFEAYALHALLLPLAMLTFLNYLNEELGAKRGRGWPPSRGAWGFAFVLGLAFANHMTIVILAPAFLYLFFNTFGFNVSSFRRILGLVPGFLLGLLPYLYLPIRAAADPAINWGHVTTLPRFLDHITGEQFRQLMFRPSVPADQLGWYFATLPSEFVYVGLILALVGIVVLFRRSLSVGIFTGLLFLFCLIYSGTYAIKEIEPYFMTATLTVGIWSMFGLWGLLQRFGRTAALGLGVLSVIAAGALHYGRVDQSDNTMVEDLARNIIDPLPKNSVLLTTRWDIFLAGTMYLQYAEGYRPDVSVVNVNMLHDRVYLSQVLERNPEFKRVSKRIREFVNERKRMDQGMRSERKDSLGYSRLFYRMVNGIISTNKRPTFVTWEVDTLVGYGWNRTPVGLVYGLTIDSTYLGLKPREYRYRLPENRENPDVMSAAVFYARAELARAAYERKFGREAEAGVHAERAATFDPGIDPEDVPVLPMGNQQYMREGAEFFRGLGGK